MKATRERKIEFMRSFGYGAFERAIMEAVYRNGAEHFLTDEQLDEIVEERVSATRLSNWLLIQNRRNTS